MFVSVKSGGYINIPVSRFVTYGCTGGGVMGKHGNLTLGALRVYRPPHYPVGDTYNDEGVASAIFMLTTRRSLLSSHII